MKKLVVLSALLLLLPCAALAGGNETDNETVERGYFATIAPEPAPKAEPTLPPPEAMETVPPEKTAYPCAAVANAPSGGAVPMYEKPDDRSRVLMNYYRGARVTVLREAMPGFFMVQTGVKGASIMGYMRGDDLAFGSEALREIVPEFVKIELNREAVIYSYCDGLSKEIGTCTTEGEYYTVGKNDGKWVQLADPTGMMLEDPEGFWNNVLEEPDAVAGFVQLETGMARGYEHIALRWNVEPIPGEITREQAVELAIWWMMNAEGEIPGELRQEEVLRLLPFDVIWSCSPPDSGFVEVSVDVTYECDEYTINMGLYPDGEIRYGIYEEAAEGS